VAEKDMITMSRKEARRLHIIHQALDKKISQTEAAALAGLSDRQLRRLIKRIRQEGDEGICHRSRGASSNHRILAKVKEKALWLFREKYKDFNLTHATEQLAETHAITISRETLRLWLTAAEIPYKKRKARKHRQWRERKAHFGELVQIDGSHHDWFEGRGPVCVFMGYIDDATSTVSGRFYAYEGTIPAMDSMKRYIRRYGIPQSVYLDKHSTYKSPAEPTIEEFLKTFLPKYNRKFKKPAASGADLHRPAPHSRELDRILCLKEERTVRNDFTVIYGSKLYQIEKATRAKTIIVEERLDGTLHITHNGQDLAYGEIKPASTKKKPRSVSLKPVKEPWIPPVGHPWRRTFLTKQKTRVRLSAAP
jgi:transposase